MNVMIFGTFDGLHEGHRFLVKQAKEYGMVIAVVGTDPNVHHIKGRTPQRTLQERINNLAAEFPEIKVIAGSFQDFLAPLRTEKPDLLLFGYDQKLPPGITLEGLKWPWKRAKALEPHIYKSSLLARAGKQVIEENDKK